MSSVVRRALVHAALLMSFATLSTRLSAQSTGIVRGTVTAADKGTPLSGVRVAVESPSRIVVTNASGQFILRGVPTGRYDIVFTALGYTALHRDVQVTAGVTTLDAAMTTGSLMLSSVITTATRSPTEARLVAATVNVLTPQQIATSAARESQDLLREIPAVELPRTSSLIGGTAQIVSIRGVDEGRTAVLFDGIPVNDAWGEWIDWGRVPKSMLDRVEVVEGGTSSLYGNGAMGGIISFFSKPLSPGDVTLSADGGQRDAQHLALSAGVPIAGALTATVSGDYQAGGGYVLLDPSKVGAIDTRSQVYQRNGYARVTYAPSARFSAFVTGHLYGDNRELGTYLAAQSRQQQSIDAGVNMAQIAGGQLTLRGWDGSQTEHQRATTIRTGGRAFEDSSVTAVIPSHDWGASALWSRASVLHLQSVSVGGDYRAYNGSYDEVNFNTSCPGANCGAVTRRVSSGGDQSLSGAFVQAIASPVTPLRIELSARVDHWNNANGFSNDLAAGRVGYPDSSKTAFSPRVGVRYQLHPRFALHAAGYRAFRAPNLAELYRKQISATSITLPNPYLKAETALGREVGFDWQPSDWIQLKGTYYVADYDDFNVPVTFTTDKPAACGTIATCRQRQNVNESRSEGAEGYVALRPVRSLFISAAVMYDDARQESGLTPAQQNNKPHINRVPSPKQTVRATWTSALLGEYTAIWRFEGHTTTLQGAQLEPYAVIDFSVRRQVVRGLQGFAALENAGNTKYQINVSGTGATALYSYGMPRTFRAGMTVSRY